MFGMNPDPDEAMRTRDVAAHTAPLGREGMGCKADEHSYSPACIGGSEAAHGGEKFAERARSNAGLDHHFLHPADWSVEAARLGAVRRVEEGEAVWLQQRSRLGGIGAEQKILLRVIGGGGLERGGGGGRRLSRGRRRGTECRDSRGATRISFPPPPRCRSSGRARRHCRRRAEGLRRRIEAGEPVDAEGNPWTEYGVARGVGQGVANHRERGRGGSVGQTLERCRRSGQGAETDAHHRPVGVVCGHAILAAARRVQYTRAAKATMCRKPSAVNTGT